MGKRQAFDPGRTRTVALVGHRSAGKTSLGEVLLHAAGVTRTIGQVDRRTSLLDFHEEERRRGLSLQLSYAWLEWADHQIHLVDTPGSEAAAHQRAFGLAAVDAAIVVIDGSAGIQVGTEDAIAEAVERGLPLLAVVNKAERARGGGHGFDDVVADLGARLAAARRPGETDGARPVPLCLPFVEEGEVRGLISVLDERVLRYSAEGDGAWSPEPVPERDRDRLAAAREQLAEAVALTDDDLLEHYLEFLELPADALGRGLVEAVRSGRIVPVVAASASLAIGAAPLLDLIVRLLPSPVDRVPPIARDEDGAPVALGCEGPFVAQLVSTHDDGEGQPYHVIRVWSGTPPRGPWHVVRTGARTRIQKLYEIRGPRRASAHSLGAGALLATWEPLAARPGDTLTDGARLALSAPVMPAPMSGWLVRSLQRPPRLARGPVRVTDERHLRERLVRAAEALADRDPGLRIAEEPTTGGLLLFGTGEAHLDLTMERLRLVLGDELQSELPPVPYRETPRRVVRGVQGLHLRETHDGLVHEHGCCVVDLLPGDPAAALAFRDELPPDDIDELPLRFRPAVEEGARRAAAHGPTAGYPVVGCVVALVGGAYDILQSTEEHFRKAGEKALRSALQRSGTALLEPWCHVEIAVPHGFVGDVLSDVASHRGRVTGMDTPDDTLGAGRPVEGVVGARALTRIEALCPYRELRTFAGRLKALTQGRGRFVSRHSHYEPLPVHLEGEAIATSPFLDRRPQAQEATERGLAAVGADP